MLFQSLIFIFVFLPIAIAGYYSLARWAVWREWWLVAASAIFYGWWDIRFLPLMFSQAAVSWLIVRLFGANRASFFLAAAANLVVLILFKYLGFVLENAEAIVGLELPENPLILPIGISFYTFHIISYLLDLTRGNAPLYGFRRFILYVVYFPQLVAGPIIRHWEILPQLNLDPLRRGVSERIGRGGLLFVLGLGKKVLLADQLAPAADAIFKSAGSAIPVAGDAWAGALAFTFQLYFDFSAYSDMAIGIAMMMGIRLPDNFDSPYRSQNIQDFWRRWHMTLSRFFRDYLYVPLGGSRHGAWRYIFATFTTFGLCGLWHGAGWTFVVWGLMHGAGLIIHRGFGTIGWRIPAPVAWLITMVFVIVGWVLFRATDFGMAHNMLSGMFLVPGWGSATVWPHLAICAAIVMLAPKAVMFSLERARPNWPMALAASLVLALSIMRVAVVEPSAFIYFQF